jgi:hypothetical protein
VTASKIKIKYTRLETAKEVTNIDFSRIVLWEKIGDKLRTFDSRTQDGKSVFVENGISRLTKEPANLFEKCLN